MFLYRLAVAIVAAASPLLAAIAQAQAPPGIAPWSPLEGRPDTAGAMSLAPLAGPSEPTPADRLPVGRLKVPKGFAIEVYASGIPNARTLRVSNKGTVFVGARVSDKVYAIVDAGGHTEVKVVASGLYRPNGLAIRNGTLYIAELSQISKIDNVENLLDDPPKPVVIYDDLPKDEAFGARFIGIGPDNRLYIGIAAPCNSCIAPETHGQIRRINLDGTGAEVVARGIRNTVGFDWHPVTRELYFTENSRDWLSEDLPNDELNRLTKPGQNFGAPYCLQGDIADPEFGWGHSCGSEFVAPIVKLGVHAAPLGMRFYTGRAFPTEFQNAILIARHGSWNRTVKTGGDVVLVRLEHDGAAKPPEPFITGFLVNNTYIGRPADIAVMRDGSLLVSDDWNGAVYRVTYQKPKGARGR